MNQKIFILISFFTFSSLSSFAVIDVKENIQNIEKTSFSKIKKEKRKWFQRRSKIEKRKFRLLDIFYKRKKTDNRETLRLAKYSLALAVVGIILLIVIYDSFILFYMLFEIPALILGIKSWRKIRELPTKLKGKGMAWAAIIISGLGIALFFFFLYLFFSGAWT